MQNEMTHPSFEYEQVLFSNKDNTKRYKTKPVNGIEEKKPKDNHPIL